MPLLLGIVAALIIGQRVAGLGFDWITLDLVSPLDRSVRVGGIRSDLIRGLTEGGLAGEGIGYNTLGQPDTLIVEQGFGAMLYSIGVIGLLLWLWAGISIIRFLNRHRSPTSDMALALTCIWFFLLPLQGFASVQDPIVSWPTWIVIGWVAGSAIRQQQVQQRSLPQQERLLPVGGAAAVSRR